MPKETVQEKALRYIAEGRVRVRRVDPIAGEAEVSVQGSKKEPYRQVFRQGGWSCNCEARLECAHLVAARLIIELAPSDPELFKADDADLDSLLDV